jgi:pimeloyl-ACP methyl ester carboxylesterase
MSLIADKYTNGDADGAVTTFWDFTSELEGLAELIEPVLPEGARELAAVDLGTWLQVDLPAMAKWMADPAAVKEITTPFTWIGGTDSAPVFTESRALLQEWLPTTRAADIVGVGHYFPVLKPAETAATLDELLMRSAAPAQ